MSLNKIYQQIRKIFKSNDICENKIEYFAILINALANIIQSEKNQLKVVELFSYIKKKYNMISSTNSNKVLDDAYNNLCDKAKQYNNIIELHDIIQDAIKQSPKFRKYYKNAISVLKSISEIDGISLVDVAERYSSYDISMRMMTAIDWIESVFPEYNAKIKQAAIIKLESKYRQDNINSERIQEELERNILNFPREAEKAYEITIISRRKVQIDENH